MSEPEATVRRRLTGAILSVVALTIVLLGVPLVIAVEHSYESAHVVMLQRRAAEALAEITLPLDAVRLQKLSDEADSEGPYSVYDASGGLLSGHGAPRPNQAVQQALAGDAASNISASQLTVAVPITDRTTERIVGAVLVTQATSVVHRRVERAILIMAIVAAIVLMIAWWIASAYSRRLTRPIEHLAAQAQRIGDGGVVVQHQRSGLAEIDAVGTALSTSSTRLTEQLSRERSFTADVSHQLRTPLAGLRLLLESASAGTDPGAGIMSALTELDRLEATVDHLLALSRDSLPVASPIQVDAVLAALSGRWTDQFHRARRSLVVNANTAGVEIHASRSAIDQVIDILISNSLDHGQGATRISSRLVAGGIAIDVTDDGSGIESSSAEAVFERGYGKGNGIGLALARTLAEADGGRLILMNHQPPRFTLLFSTTDEPNRARLRSEAAVGARD